VGASAGLNLLCDRYRLDYGAHGVSGPRTSPVRISCLVTGGDPPVAERLPGVVARVGIDRDPVDVANPDDARWLLACVWPDTGRLQRTAASIRLAQDDPPPLVAGDANEVLPGVLSDLPGGAAAVILTTWAFAYFSVEDRRRFVELLKLESRSRPIAWLSAEGVGVVEAFATDLPPHHDPALPSVFGAVIFEGGAMRPRLLGLVQQHGAWIDWLAGHHPGALMAD